MAATQCILVSRCGEDGLLKFKPSIRMGKKGDLNNFECGMVVGPRRADLSISKTQTEFDTFGLSHYFLPPVLPVALLSSVACELALLKIVFLCVFFLFLPPFLYV